MNDAEIKRIVEGTAPVGNPVVIKLLEETLAAARAGKVSGIAIVREHSGMMMAQCAGAMTAAIYFGCDCLKDTLKAQLTGGGARGPGIMRPM